MSAKTKQWTGRIKQAAGSLTGHKRLEREGAADRRSGEAGERIAHAKGKVNQTIDKAASAVKSVFRTGNNK
jgi:uncharacterized protein YjbJ (UPF0337 family)